MPLWLPGEQVSYRCLVPGCGAKFDAHAKKQYMKHVADCASSTTIYEEHAAARDNNYFTGLADTEQFEWRRKHELQRPGGNDDA